MVKFMVSPALEEVKPKTETPDCLCNDCSLQGAGCCPKPFSSCPPSPEKGQEIHPTDKKE